MNKTPISTLMEYLTVRRLKAPVFEEIERFGPPHQPTFRIRIIANGFKAEGEGNSKQDAKQKAAENLMKILKTNDGSVYKLDKDMNDNCEKFNNNEKSVLVDEEVNYNAIGALTDLCTQNKFPLPEFEILKVEGPDHLKIFTMKCIVFPVNGVGRSNKKQKAMHIAANKVLEEIKQELEEKKQMRRIQAVKKSSTKSSDAVIRQYNKIKDPIKLNKATANIHDCHNNYESIQDNSVTLQQLIYEEVDLEDPYKTVKKITNELGVQLIIRALDSTQLKGTPNSKVSLMKLTTDPPVISLGYDIKDAAENLIDSLKVLCG